LTDDALPRIPEEWQPFAVPLSNLKPYPGNAKRHDLDTIRASLRRRGQYRMAVVQRSTGYVCVGNGMLEAARLEEWPALAVHYRDLTDDEARELVLIDNRSTELGGYDSDALVELLQAMPTLEFTGYDDDALASLLAQTNAGAHGDARAQEVARGRAMNGAKRKAPLDLIFSTSASGSHAEGQAAMRLGWQVGVISSGIRAARMFYQRFPRAPRLAFMDNEWHDYDHAAHLTAVAEMRPRYATVRDLVTKEQAREAGVEWHSLGDTLVMAEQIAEHVDNVILIPKYDVLGQLPHTIGKARVVLGYSVESSYGGTPLPIETFRGWPIHLLGGSWTTQRAYLNLMGDDVVSLDNNHVLRVAQFGQTCLRDGSMVTLDELLGYHISAGSFMPALVLSLANIATEVLDTYGAAVTPVELGDDFSTPDITRDGVPA
jgi:ParB-like chromosome segregation protein Spo0J